MRAGRGPWVRWCWRGLRWGVAAAVAIEFGRVVFGDNLHAWVPGRVYRSAHPSPALLANLQRRGLRTVVNLRGTCPGMPWYDSEAAATHALGLYQEDLTLSASRMPPPHELRNLLDILDGAEYPILVHCKRGVDRTGLVSAVVKLLQPGSKLDDGIAALSLRYSHFRVSKTGAMDEFLDQYAGWLRDRGEQHRPDLLRQYIRTAYSPGEAAGRMELVERPAAIAAGRPFGIRIRAVNQSQYPWTLLAGTAVGVHVRFRVEAAGGVEVAKGHAGLFRATVPSGDGIALTLAVPGLPPGDYALHADLMDGPEISFSQMGGDPLVVLFTVPRPPEPPHA